MFKLNFLLLLFVLAIGTLQAQIFSNGPISNSIGTGAGGTDESMLYTTTFSMGTIGFGQQTTSYNRIADDFTVDCSWTIDSIYLYGYQTGSTTTSTFTSYNLRIWDGIPEAVGSNIVFGDTVTNRLVRTTFSNVYRVTETTSGNTARPIMQNTIAVGITLPAGTYYLDWSAAGSLASGPWQPPVVLPMQNTTGNALQRIGSIWNNLVDGGTGTPAQGAPFLIWGDAASLIADAGSITDICQNTPFQLGGSPTGFSNVASPLTYAWTGNGISDTTQSNPIATISSSSQFVVVVSDTNGCVASDTLFVNTNDIPDLTMPADLTICYGDTVELFAISNSTVVWNDSILNGTLVIPSVNASYIAVATSSFNCTDTGVFNVIVNSPTNASLNLTGIDSVVVNGISYYQDGTYTQNLINSNGCDSILTINVNLDFTELNENNLSFKVTPNPSSDFITIENSHTKEARYILLNLEGKEIARIETNEFTYTLDVKNLSKGTYILRNIDLNLDQLIIKQ